MVDGKSCAKVEQTTELWGPEELLWQRSNRRSMQAGIAGKRQSWIDRNAYFYGKLGSLLRFLIRPGERVLNIRSGTGWFLDAVRAGRGLGVDLSQEMVDIAAANGKYEYRVADPEDLTIDEKFDYVIFNHPSETVDLLAALERVRPCCEPHTRMFVYGFNSWWRPVIELAERRGWKVPSIENNWLSDQDIISMAERAGFDHIETHKEFLLPKKIPLLSTFLNDIVAHLPFFRQLTMARIYVFRPRPVPREPADLKVSVIVPCRNERDNIEPAVRRIPELGGKGTEIIFCDDKSTDGTADAVRKCQQAYPHKDIHLVAGPGICKSSNVWTGFDHATGDILLILDADLAVMPEELPYFVQSIAAGDGEFINGTRLVYPMQKFAMKTANLLGNRAFGIFFSFLLNQRITDTLCGTKVIWRRDWETRIKPGLNQWGTHDRWGDYELLLGAAKSHLPICEIPVHYQERVYGVTKMTNVFRNGIIMLKIWLSGFIKMKLRWNSDG